MSQKDNVIAYRDALKFGGATEFRLSLSTDTAMALADELEASDLTHGEKVKAAVISWKKLAGTPLPDTFDGRHAHVTAQGVAAADFWDAFNGQEVAGVEITRRR